MFASAAPTTASPPVTAAAPTAAAEPSAAERLFANFEAVWRNLLSLDPREVVVNLALSLLVMAIVAGLVWLLRRMLHAGLDHLATHDGEPPPESNPSGSPRVAKLTWVLIRLAIGALALVVLLSIWGVDLVGWLTGGSGAVLLRLGFILLLAVGVVEVAGQVIDRLLNAAAKHSPEGRRTAQVHTMRPLVRGVVQGFVIIIASLTALSELGVKIGPLLASAGVVGIALGFGAQTIVKDFLTGLFLIIEDIVAVGDNVRIGERAGTVEAMTLRTIRVRNIDGTLHILPYSEAQIIDNRTKVFSAYVFSLGVSYDADIEHAFEVMRRVGEDMLREPAFASKIQQPLEILGVDALGDSAVVLKARFRTEPGEQWRIGREYNRRIKQAFDAEGIEIPFPMRKLVFDGGPMPPPSAKGFNGHGEMEDADGDSE